MGKAIDEECIAAVRGSFVRVLAPKARGLIELVLFESSCSAESDAVCDLVSELLRRRSQPAVAGGTG